MEKITFIVPLHKYDDKIDTYLTSAVNSVKAFNSSSAEFSFIGPAEVMVSAKENAEKNGIADISNFYDNEDTDVFKQINQAVKYCLNPYFSVLEFDDTYNSYWLDEFEKYSKVNSDASIYMPIVELLNIDGRVVGFVNEIAWSTTFSADEIGYLDLECMKTYLDFNVTGAIIRTEDFISVGCLKPSLKIAAWYEFLMRLANNKKNIYVIPKAGYNHLIGREDSYMTIASSEIDMAYGQWLIQKAQEEYVNNIENEIVYTPNESKNND